MSLRRVRREKQLAARRSNAGLLAAAYRRIEDLERQVAQLQATNDSFQQMAAKESELSGRLALTAPVLAKGIARKEPLLLEKKKRDTAEHNFDVPAAEICVATCVQLNRWQREGRRNVGFGSGRQPDAPSPPVTTRSRPSMEIKVEPALSAAGTGVCIVDVKSLTWQLNEEDIEATPLKPIDVWGKVKFDDEKR